MLENIEIKNYKIIDSLKVENLTNINVFVGKNNCGKTTLLEGIFFNLKPTNPEILIRVISSAIRHIKLANDNLDWFFYKMDINNFIEINSKYNGKKMHLKIKPKFLESTTLKILENNDMFNDHNFNNFQQERLIGLNFEVRFNDEKDAKFDLTISGNEIKYGKVQDYPSFLGVFIPSNNMNFNNVKIVEDIRKLKKEKKLNDYIRIFDKNILSAEVINNEIMLDVKDMPKRISSNTMGEGFEKYLSIISVCIINHYQYICIDEIENGLHFESMKKLIEALVEFCKETNIQLFISTHSYEFLDILNDVALGQKYKNVAVFNLKQAENGLQVRYYDMSDLKHLFNANIEFRK